MRYSVALTADLNVRLCGHLARSDHQEDLCFAIWSPSKGAGRITALLREVVLPETGDRSVHGNASFEGQYVLRALARARELEGGIAFLHSHPYGGWQGMSADDVRAEQGMAGAALGATGLPLVGLTLGASDGAWSARFWERVGPRKFERRWCESVRVVGERLHVHYYDRLLPPPRPTGAQVRTVSAWGDRAQADLARLRVGVIGLGSVGSIVAEALARMGVQRLLLMDFDHAEDLNRDRTLHMTAKHAQRGLPKVQIQAEALRQSATSDHFEVESVELSVCEDEGYRRALDCDVLFSCVDRPWPRSILNFIAYSALVPVVDGGIAAFRTKRRTLRGADWRAHVAGPENACLICVGQYDPAHVQTEREGHLDDPKYIQTLDEEHPLRTRENVFTFSLGCASLEMCAFTLLTVGAAGLGFRKGQDYHLATGTIDDLAHSCAPDCDSSGLLARGDRAGTPGTGQHVAAERARQSRRPGRVAAAWNGQTREEKTERAARVRRSGRAPKGPRPR